MYQINDDLSIYVTRGDVVLFSVTAENDSGSYTFQTEDVVRLKVFAKKNCENVVLQKEFVVTEETQKVDIFLTESDTKIGDVISKPTDYWYEVELNPLTNPQTIIGYDEDGAKIFRLYPEGSDTLDETEEEDIPVVDDEFSLSSPRPLENQVVTRRFMKLEKEVEEKLTSKIEKVTQDEWNELVKGGLWENNTIYLIIDGSKESLQNSEALDKASSALNQSEEALSIANSFSEHIERISTNLNEVSEEVKKCAKTLTLIVEVSADLWVEDAINGGYLCTIALEGVLATDNPIVDIVLTSDRDTNALCVSAWQSVTRIVTSDKEVTLYANNDKPTSAFTMQLKVVR